MKLIDRLKEWMNPHYHCYHLHRITTEPDKQHRVMSRTCCKCGRVDEYRYCCPVNKRIVVLGDGGKSPVSVQGWYDKPCRN